VTQITQEQVLSLVQTVIPWSVISLENKAVQHWTRVFADLGITDRQQALQMIQTIFEQNVAALAISARELEKGSQ